MRDAHLIYRACVRAEQKLLSKVAALAQGDDPAGIMAHGTAALIAISTLREEIGNGLFRRPTALKTGGEK